MLTVNLFPLSAWKRVQDRPSQPWKIIIQKFNCPNISIYDQESDIFRVATLNCDVKSNVQRLSSYCKAFVLLR